MDIGEKVQSRKQRIFARGILLFLLVFTGGCATYSTQKDLGRDSYTKSRIYPEMKPARLASLDVVGELLYSPFQTLVNFLTFRPFFDHSGYMGSGAVNTFLTIFSVLPGYSHRDGNFLWFGHRGPPRDYTPPEEWEEKSDSKNKDKENSENKDEDRNEK